MSRNAVMRKALGATVEEECRLGVSKIANVGQTNLIPRNLSGSAWPAVLTIVRWFVSCSRATSDFCSPTSSRRW